MYCLGIETSCDETALALLEWEKDSHPKVVESLVSSQVALHQEYGGVVPELAAREHMRNLPLLFSKIMKEAGISLSELSLLGVTAGPGLKGCLLMGVNFARGLALGSGVPLVAVHHIEAHLWSAVLENPQIETPFIGFIVSGGHTEIHLVKGWGESELLARTIDDAAGEAFDKSAHLMGFPYPGGPLLSAAAQQGSADVAKQFSLPKVMREAEGFSFSGLKTAVSLLIREQEEQLRADESSRNALAKAIEESIVDALLFKLKKALQETGLKTIVVGGGVAANHLFRKELKALSGCKAYFPSQDLCMDNAMMIAFAAIERERRGRSLSVNGNVFPRWPLEDIALPASYGQSVLQDVVPVR